MYNGYLRDHVEQIRALHERGATTREIAESLYLAGARTNTSDPAAHSRVMSREHHIANLQTMALFVLQRLGLRRRRVRVLNLKAAERVTKWALPRESALLIPTTRLQRAATRRQRHVFTRRQRPDARWGRAMTAPLRQQGIRIDPLAVFVARAEARALLWQAGEFDLHAAVDELWAAAVRDGLVAKLGADKVQQLLADAFAPVRDDLPHYEDAVPELINEEQELSSVVPLATLQAAEFLIQQKDPARLRAWLAKHSAQERAAILQHLEQRRKARGT
jgi:hypothetical protein